MKKKLQAMLESIINEDVDKASKYFHSYLSEMIARETGIESDEMSSDDESSEMSSDDESSEKKKCDCSCSDDESSDEMSSDDESYESDDEASMEKEEM